MQLFHQQKYVHKNISIFLNQAVSIQGAFQSIESSYYICWVMTPCSLKNGYHIFGETHNFTNPGDQKMEMARPLPDCTVECFRRPQIIKTKLCGFSLQENYNDRAAAACRRSYANFCGQRVSLGQGN
jgi:hypothetical protein